MTDEITTFLLEPDRLRLTLELASRREALAAHALNTYWSNVERRVREHFDEKNFRWQLRGPGRAVERYSEFGFSLETETRPSHRCDEVPGYFVGYQCLAGYPEPLYLGVSRGVRASDVSLIPSLEPEISTVLERLGFDKKDSYWLGYQWASGLGLDAVSHSDDEMILHLNDDNRTEDYPSATRAATLLWNTFEATRLQLEQAFEQLPRS